MRVLNTTEVKVIGGGEPGPHTDYYYSTPTDDFYRSWFNTDVWGFFWDAWM